MKNKLFLLLVVVVSFVACKKNVNTPGNSSVNIISETSVPASVLATFNTSFSSATEREWQHNSSDDFSCQFNMENERHEAHFDDNGHEKSHDVVCVNAAVPANVLNAFRTAFPKDNVYEWSFTSDKMWKAHFMRGGVKWEVTITADGVITKTEHE